MLILNQFGSVQNRQTSPIPKTSFLVGTFFWILTARPINKQKDSETGNFAKILEE